MSERSYRWDSEDYARHSAAQQEWALELIDKLALRGQEAVLDIGSGDGKVTAALAARLPRGEVLGVDSSPQMVARARKAFPRKRHPNLRFQLGDALDLRFVARFDVAFSNATLHWVHDHLRVLKGVARALKPGGRLLFQMGGRGNAREVLEVLEGLARERPWDAWLAGRSAPYGFYGPEEYTGWLRQAGLEARRVELIPKLMQQRGAEGLAGWIRTTWLPYTQAVPEERREELVGEVVRRYLRGHPPGTDGAVAVGMVRLEVEAAREGGEPRAAALDDR
jgi:trans-aconitate 2-methyltransferase